MSRRAKVKAGNARQAAEANALYLHTHYQDSGEASPTAYGGEMSKMGPSVGGLPACRVGFMPRDEGIRYGQGRPAKEGVSIAHSTYKTKWLRLFWGKDPTSRKARVSRTSTSTSRRMHRKNAY